MASLDERLAANEEEQRAAAVALQKMARGQSGRRHATAEWEREDRGWLWRQGTIRSRMVHFWFVLKISAENTCELCFYADDSEQKLVGSVPLANAMCYCTVPQAGHSYCFRLRPDTPGRLFNAPLYLLAAESADERRRWVTTILRHASGHIVEAPARNRVIFFYGRGGGGHKASANAVRDTLMEDTEDEGALEVDIQMRDFGLMVEDPILGPVTKRIFNRIGVPGGDGMYNFMMARGWYRGAQFITKLGTFSVDNNYTAIGDWFCGYFAAERPSLIVSYVPLANRVLREALGHVLPGVQILTVITDMEHSEAHRWIDAFDVRSRRVIAGDSGWQQVAAGSRGWQWVAAGGSSRLTLTSDDVLT